MKSFVGALFYTKRRVRVENIWKRISHPVIATGKWLESLANIKGENEHI